MVRAAGRCLAEQLGAPADLDRAAVDHRRRSGVPGASSRTRRRRPRREGSASLRGHRRERGAGLGRGACGASRGRPRGGTEPLVLPPGSRARPCTAWSAVGSGWRREGARRDDIVVALGRRGGRRSGRLRRRHVPARSGAVAGPHQPARPGRFERGRQDRYQPGGRQEPGRRLLPARPGRDRPGDPGHLAATRSS